MKTAQINCHALSRYYRNAIRYLKCHNIDRNYSFLSCFYSGVEVKNDGFKTYSSTA
jgi:hypothetical protein